MYFNVLCDTFCVATFFIYLATAVITRGSKRTIHNCCRCVGAEVTDADIVRLAAGLCDLRWLSLKGCNRLGAGALQPLISLHSECLIPVRTIVPMFFTLLFKEP